MRAGKPLPVLYTPSTEGCEANIGDTNDSKSEFKIEHTGTAVFGCVRPCVLNDKAEKEENAVKLENSINYYYTVLALRLLLERGLISEDEYGKICRYNAEFYKPEREYI